MNATLKLYDFAGNCASSTPVEDTNKWKLVAIAAMNAIPESNRSDIYGAVFEVDGVRSGEIKTERARQLEGGAK